MQHEASMNPQAEGSRSREVVGLLDAMQFEALSFLKPVDCSDSTAQSVSIFTFQLSVFTLSHLLFPMNKTLTLIFH